MGRFFSTTEVTCKTIKQFSMFQEYKHRNIMKWRSHGIRFDAKGKPSHTCGLYEHQFSFTLLKLEPAYVFLQNLGDCCLINFEPCRSDMFLYNIMVIFYICLTEYSENYFRLIKCSEIFFKNLFIFIEVKIMIF